MDNSVAPGQPAFPMQRTCPFKIAPGYDKLRAEEPIAQVKMPTGETVWLITKYDYVRQILAHPQVSADRHHPGFPVLLGLPNRETMRAVGRGSLIGMDPPTHTIHRRVLITEFTVKQVRAIRPRLQEIVDECVAETLRDGPPVDLVQTLALPVPTHVVCELLGVPYADRESFHRRTKIMLDRNATEIDKRTAGGELLMFFVELVERKEKDPGDDLLGRLITRYRRDGMYERDLLIGIAGLLLTGGHETTANMIALGTIALLENEDQLAALRANPTQMPTAVEELLRYFSVAAELTGYRAALADIEIGGVVIREGDGIIALGSAANRDPDVFENPDKLDIERGARHHVAFGYGMHQCLGQNLARLELEITLNTLFTKIPGLRLAAPLDELPFKSDASVYGVHQLPVTW
jgi:cytochrome P450